MSSTRKRNEKATSTAPSTCRRAAVDRPGHVEVTDTELLIRRLAITDRAVIRAANESADAEQWLRYVIGQGAYGADVSRAAARLLAATTEIEVFLSVLTDWWIQLSV